MYAFEHKQLQQLSLSAKNELIKIVVRRKSAFHFT